MSKRNEAIARYQKRAMKQQMLKLNKYTEKDLIDKLDTKNNKQGYIKSLIRLDIERGLV